MLLTARTTADRDTAQRSLRIDLAIAVVLLVVASVVGTQYVRTLRAARFLPDVTGLEQQTFGAALMNVCGRGLKTPVLPMTVGPDTPAAQRPLIEFLTQRREQIACDEIPADVPAEAGALQETSRYLLMICELPWRLGATSWASFDWLLSGMFGIAIVGAFAAARVVMRRTLATAVAAAYLFSPMHLANMVDVRDYSKTPFFTATLFVLALLVVRPRRAPVVLGLAALAGAVLGFGFGMRTDVALNLPLIWVGVALFLPQPLSTSWLIRLGAVALSLVTFLAAASPILTSRQSGNFLWHWGLLGFGQEFDRELGIARAPYELGHFYDDSYVAATVDSYAYRTTGAPQSTRYDTPRFTVLSREYYWRIVRTFPADAFVRGEAAAIKILGLPFRNDRLAHPDRLPGMLAAVIDWRSRLLGLFGYAGVAIFALVVAATSVRSLRLALALVTIVALLGGYPAIQFQMRHYFHLEVLSLVCLGLIVQHRRLLAEARGIAIRGGAFVLLACAVVMLPLWALRIYQQRSAGALLDTYERAPMVAIATHPSADGGGMVSLATAADVLPVDDGIRPMFSEQVVVETVPSGCAAGTVSVTFKYTVTTGMDYSRTFAVHGPEPSRIFFTLLHTASAGPLPRHFVFDRIQVPADQTGCVGRISRFTQPESFALLLPAVLPAGWRTLPLRQELRGWGALSARANPHD